MLKILDAIQFGNVFTKGGRTEPWLVHVLVEGERQPYVVKLFRSEEIDREHTVAREVFGSLLANEFELTVPEPALINFSKAFIDTLPLEVKEIASFKDHRLKFGCKYCDNTQLLDADLPPNHLPKIAHEAATIFAFDTLINNKDRGRVKTNILISISDDNYYIFDHERAFKNIKQLHTEVLLNRFSETLENHVFHSYLAKKRHKKELFHTFHEYLKRLNIDCLDAYNNVLVNYELGHSEIDDLKSYLYKLKQKHDWFVGVLINCIAK